MEVKVKESNRFCCELVRSSSFATKSILIFIFSLCLCLMTSTNVKAEQFEFNNDITQTIVNYYRNNNQINNNNDREQLFQNIDITNFTNMLNNSLNIINFDINEENIILYYTPGTYQDTIYLFISKNESNNNNLAQIQNYIFNNGSRYIYYLSKKIINSNDEKAYYISFNIDNYANKGNITNSNSGEIAARQTALQIESSNTNNFSNIQYKFLSFYNGNFIYDYNTTNKNVLENVIDYNFNQKTIEETDQSEYGYLWSPAHSGETRVNLLYNGNTVIDCDYYIGNELSHTYNFYYMSGDTKISVNDYISIGTTQTQSGEWYKHYITNSGKQHLPNNTHFLLDVYASYGNQTATVVEGFNAFYTVEEVITTPTPTPTSTPTPTTEPTIGTISGQINDINNNITGSTQTIIEQISGDAEKITDVIKDKITEEELENILPISGDYVTQMGYKPQISPYNGFIINIYNVIKEALLGQGNVNLYVEFNGYSEWIASDRYYIPNNPFKIWLSAGMIALICWQIAKFGDQITQKLEKADINVMHYADADMYFF